MAEEMIEESASLKRNEKGPLEHYHNQTTIYKQFGDEGVRVYAAIKEGATAHDLLAHLRMDEARLMELLDFMDQHGLIMVEHKGGAAMRAPSASSAPVPTSTTYRPPPSTPAEKMTDAEKEIAGEIEEREKEVKKTSWSRGAEEAERSITEEIAERAEELKRPMGRYEAPPVPSEAPVQMEAPQPPPSGRERKVEESLSPLERTISNKFGKVGLQVYNLIDGEKTAEEILEETGISEVKLVEILEFMDKEGIIKLEKPGEEGGKEEAGGGEGGDAGPKFEPMIEEKHEVEEKLEADAIPIDLPVRQPVSLLRGLYLKLELLLRFRMAGLKVYNSIDGKKDIVQIAKETGASLGAIDAVLSLLGTRGAALFKQLSPKEAKAKYGEDGLAIYRKYGREGMLVYELIGSEESIRDIVYKSRLEKNRAVDIFMYIHRILGLELAIDRQTLLRQLG